MSLLLSQIASDDILHEAYRWLCNARKKSHHNNGVWHLRFHWNEIKPQIQTDLLNGTYRFSPCKSYKINGEGIGVWNAQDALVLKAMAIVLTKHLSPNLSKDCYHLSGRGGAKGCVMQIKNEVEHYKYVCRSDVDSYYASINHKILLKQLSTLISESTVLALIKRMLERLDDVNGELFTVVIGLSKGNPLSPLLGGVYLKVMDDRIGSYCQRHDLKYYRFMDDWLILCKTRNQLRTVVRLMNQILEEVKQKKHPFKTYIGRIKEEGFDFLGYRIGNKIINGLTLAWKTWANHQAKLKQLYEQNVSKERIAEYVKRWSIWVRSGVEIDLKAVIEGLSKAHLVDGLYGEWV